VSKEFIS